MKPRPRNKPAEVNHEKVFDIETFCQDYNIPFKHRGEQWLQVYCPFCEDTTWCGGFSLKTNCYSCFRCGRHSKPSLIQALTGRSWGEVYEVLAKYGSAGTDGIRLAESGQKPRPGRVELPEHTEPLMERHKKYLRSRHFDPDDLADTWGILGTGSLGSHANRIVIPIFFNGKMVSWTTRSIHSSAEIEELGIPRYLSCPDELEVLHHKELIYGYDYILDIAVILEGAVDVWNFGFGAGCTLGTQFTPRQISLMSKKKKNYIMYDNEPKAQLLAHNLADSLCLFTDVEIVTSNDIFGSDRDMGDLTKTEVAYIRKELGL